MVLLPDCIARYYRAAKTVLAWWAAVVRLQGSGTTMGTCGTTAPPRSTTADAYGTTVFLGAILPQPTTSARQGRQENGGSSKEKRRGQEGDVYVMIPSKPFQRGPPLNSMAFLRLKSTEKKHRETSSSLGSEGHRIILCLDMRYLKCSIHTISP